MWFLEWWKFVHTSGPWVWTGSFLLVLVISDAARGVLGAAVRVVMSFARGPR
jgi:hypothetical protein